MIRFSQQFSFRQSDDCVNGYHLQEFFNARRWNQVTSMRDEIGLTSLSH